MFQACFDSFWINSRIFETTQNHIWMYNMNLILYTIANIGFNLILFNMRFDEFIYQFHFEDIKDNKIFKVIHAPTTK